MEGRGRECCDRVLRQMAASGLAELTYRGASWSGRKSIDELQILVSGFELPGGTRAEMCHAPFWSEPRQGVLQ